MKKILKKQTESVDEKVNLYASEGNFLCEGQCGCEVSEPGQYCAGSDGCDCGCGCGGAPDGQPVDGD